MARFENPDFERLAESLGVSLDCVSSRSFNLVFDDELPVTIGLIPKGTDVVIEVWCWDLARQIQRTASCTDGCLVAAQSRRLDCKFSTFGYRQPRLRAAARPP